jgi:hypothetical protein
MPEIVFWAKGAQFVQNRFLGFGRTCLEIAGFESIHNRFFNPTFRISLFFIKNYHPMPWRSYGPKLQSPW